MKVRDILDIQNNNMPNREKGVLITRLLKARARRYNPKDTEDPQGWNSGLYGGTPFSRSGGTMPA